MAEQQKFKVGDECWVWCPQAYGSTGLIEMGTVVAYREDAFLGTFVKLRFRERPYPFHPCELFRTRAELCEHYRKIFE